jgi:hypothetical protein
MLFAREDERLKRTVPIPWRAPILGRLEVEPTPERNGTLNLKNVWQVKELPAHFSHVWQGKGGTRFFGVGEGLERCQKAYRKQRANHKGTVPQKLLGVK